MSFNTLANLFRPKKFEDILGQSIWIDKLSKRVSENRLPPVIIIGGPSGTGKTTTARLIAKSCVCLNRPDGESNPCNQCEGCKSVDTGGGDTNYMFLDGASGDLANSVRADLVPTMQARPSMGARYRCCIIDEFQAFNHVAKSILLTLFEELPSSSKIVCTTTDVETIHEALRDRSYEISFAPIPAEEQVRGILNAQPDLEKHSNIIKLLADHSGGTQRRLWTMIDKLDGDFTEQTVQAICGVGRPSERLSILNAAINRDFTTLESIWSSWAKKGLNLSSIGDLLINDLCKMSLGDPTNITYTRAIKILDRACIVGKPDHIRRALYQIAPGYIDLKKIYEGIFGV